MYFDNHVPGFLNSLGYYIWSKVILFEQIYSNVTRTVHLNEKIDVHVPGSIKNTFLV